MDDLALSRTYFDFVDKTKGLPELYRTIACIYALSKYVQPRVMLHFNIDGFYRLRLWSSPLNKLWVHIHIVLCLVATRVRFLNNSAVGDPA